MPAPPIYLGNLAPPGTPARQLVKEPYTVVAAEKMAISLPRQRFSARLSRTVVLAGAPWFSTVSRAPRAHPTIFHRVVRRFPTSPRLSRFQPVPSFWLARHGFSPYLDRRAPTRLYSTVSLDVFRRRPDLAVFCPYRRFGCRAMVFHRISTAARPPDYSSPCR